MPMLVSLVLTGCFAGCAGYTVTRLRRSDAERATYLSHLAMAVSMLLMIWADSPALAVIGVVGSGAAAVWFAARAWGRIGHWATSLHHGAMFAVMTVMWVAMVRHTDPEASAMAHHHGAETREHRASAADRWWDDLATVDSLLLVAALALFVVAVLWWYAAYRDRRASHRVEGCRRDGALEGLASLAMAGGAAAMAVAH